MTARVVIALVTIVLAAACTADLPSSTLPDFTLTNQVGQEIRAADLRGHVLVVSFVYTSCQDVCPLVTGQLLAVQAGARAAELRFISITLDPITDTPEVLRRYAERFGVDTTTWDFLTGHPDEIARVTRAVGVFAANERGRLGHDGPVLLVDREGRVVRRYDDSRALAGVILDDLRRTYVASRSARTLPPRAAGVNGF